MDNPRVPSESFELAFFKRDVGGEYWLFFTCVHEAEAIITFFAVPVIIVLTKYEALVERVKDKLLGREPSKEEVRRHAQSNIMKPIRRAAYPPAGYVQTHRELSFFYMMILINCCFISRSWRWVRHAFGEDSWNDTDHWTGRHICNGATGIGTLTLPASISECPQVDICLIMLECHTCDWYEPCKKWWSHDAIRTNAAACGLFKASRWRTDWWRTTDAALLEKCKYIVHNNNLSSGCHAYGSFPVCRSKVENIG